MGLKIEPWSNEIPRASQLQVGMRLKGHIVSQFELEKDVIMGARKIGSMTLAFSNFFACPWKEANYKFDPQMYLRRVYFDQHNFDRRM